MQGGEYKGKTVWEQAKEMGFQTVENDPAAMNALQYKDGQKNGFFLQVEGASIDKQDHAGNACGQIGETE